MSQGGVKWLAGENQVAQEMTRVSVPEMWKRTFGHDQPLLDEHWRDNGVEEALPELQIGGWMSWASTL